MLKNYKGFTKYILLRILLMLKKTNKLLCINYLNAFIFNKKLVNKALHYLLKFLVLNDIISLIGIKKKLKKN